MLLYITTNIPEKFLITIEDDDDDNDINNKKRKKKIPFLKK